MFTPRPAKDPPHTATKVARSVAVLWTAIFLARCELSTITTHTVSHHIKPKRRGVTVCVWRLERARSLAASVENPARTHKVV